MGRFRVSPLRPRARRFPVLVQQLQKLNPGVVDQRQAEDVAKARGKSISEVLPYKAPEPEPEPELEAAGVEA